MHPNTPNTPDTPVNPAALKAALMWADAGVIIPSVCFPAGATEKYTAAYATIQPYLQKGENSLAGAVRILGAAIHAAAAIDTTSRNHIETLRNHIETLCHGITTCLAYPRGSEAQVRCLEEVGQDAAYIAKNLPSIKNPASSI